jgi:hypothetical protein
VVRRSGGKGLFLGPCGRRRGDGRSFDDHIIGKE